MSHELYIPRVELIRHGAAENTEFLRARIAHKTTHGGHERHQKPLLTSTFRVEAKGLEPSNLLTASQALYQLSYAPKREPHVTSRALSL